MIMTMNESNNKTDKPNTKLFVETGKQKQRQQAATGVIFQTKRQRMREHQQQQLHDPMMKIKNKFCSRSFFLSLGRQ